MAGKNFGFPALKPIIGGDTSTGSDGGETRPKSFSGLSAFIPSGSIGNAVSNAGSAITQTVKPVADKITPNLDQDLAKVDLSNGQSMDTTQLIPNLQQMPNVDQDLTKISVRGLQESAVEQAGDAQNALIDIGTAVQEQVVQSGKVGQEAVVKLGSDAQEQAVKSGTQISGGQSNATLEGYANQATKGIESQINQVTTYVEDKVVPFVRDLYATAYGDKGPLTLYQEAVHDFEKNTPGIEALGNLDASLNSSDDGYSSSTTQLSADTPNLGDDKVFSDLETATGKGSQMSEEERLRRIRRLLTNRYGREKTILGGPGDTTSRRRYAV